MKSKAFCYNLFKYPGDEIRNRCIIFQVILWQSCNINKWIYMHLFKII